MKVLLAGGSSGSHVLTADIGRKPDHRVSLITRRPGDWSGPVSCAEDAIRFAGMPFLQPAKKIQYAGRLEHVFDWSNVADALEWADAVIICAPVHAHPEILADIVPNLPRDKRLILGTLYGQGGFDWTLRDQLSRMDSPPEIDIFALKRFPYLCKKQSYGESVYLMGRFPKIIAAIEASNDGKKNITRLLQDLFDKPVSLLPNFSCCNLTLSNQVLHPAICWGLFSDFKPGHSYPSEKLFYGDCNELAAHTLDDLANEIRLLARACEETMSLDLHRYLGSDPPMIYSLRLRDLTWRWVSQSETLIRWRDQLMATVFRSNQRLNKAKAPMLQTENGFVPDFSSRFWLDDIPFGLCVVFGIAEILGVAMPVTAKMISTQQAWLGKRYITTGDAPRLAGEDVGETNAPQRYGVSTPDALRRLMTEPIQRSGRC